ncbi:hypothetical protein SBOR_9880 [Sclerotinia borealis F-4128]|uniref:Phosphoglycerate mutase family protein n=1 Tax=Sclerotinia borealis (strain F-4128) TaxID=1432307 RepID=W9C581_SCLBF|nr:hypothetical protein SBOR_9880 [Sclerotinia borealis F-4128]
MTRTIETTLIAFKDVMESGNVATTAWPALREWGSGKISTGSPLPELEKKYGKQLAFNLIVQEEAQRRKLNTSGNTGAVTPMEEEPYEIAIVSHAGFLEIMLEEEPGGSQNNRLGTHGFYNANMKSFSFDTIDGPGGVRYELTETEESKKRPFSSGPICRYVRKKYSSRFLKEDD